MTKEETTKVVFYIKGAYPGYYLKVNADAFKHQIMVWHDILKDEPFDRVMAGVKSAICAGTNGFPPSLDMVIEYMHRAENPGNRSGIEQIARNMAAQRGMDFDKEFAAFRKRYGL